MSYSATNTKKGRSRMKKIKALVSLLLISLVLTGCNVNGAAVPVSAPDSEAENMSLPENAASSNSASLAESAPGVSSAPKNDNSSTVNVKHQPLTQDEWERIISLFREWSFLISGIHPFMDDSDRKSPSEYYFPECVDRFNYITEERTWNTRGGVATETNHYYKVVSGACATEAGFNKKLDGIFTEEMKKKYFEASDMYMNEYLSMEYRFRDDGVYVGMLATNSYISTNTHRDRNGSMTLTLSADQISEERIWISLTCESEKYNDKYYEFVTIFKRTGNGDFRIENIHNGFITLPVLFDRKQINVVAVEGTKKFNFTYDTSQ